MSEPSKASASRKMRVTEQDSILSWNWADGEKDAFNVDALPDHIKQQLMIHGAKQKVSDTAAGKDLRESKREVRACIANLQQGVWTTKSSSTLAEAIARATGCTVDEAMEELAKASEDTIKDLRKNPAIKAAEAAIKAERAANAAKSADAPDLGTLFQ